MARGIQPHSSRDFETELRELRAHLLAMGARCERVVGLACTGFLDGTPELAIEATELDAQVDEDEVQIHSLILRILALRQPVADDLRFLVTALRLITDLERIGDEAVNITQRSVEHAAMAKTLVGSDLVTMTGAARDMLRGALDAFVRSDLEVAEGILGCDDDVDARCASIIGRLVQHMSAYPGDIQSSLRMIRVAKYLERIADHATNVAEEVIFMVSGDDVRHRRFPLNGARASRQEL